MKRTYRYRPISSIAVAVSAVLIFAAGYGMRLAFEQHAQHRQIRRDGYRYIRPLVECEVAHASPSAHPDVARIKKIVSRVVERHLAGGSAGTIAVYFRDLMTGSWFGINENERFAPASLMKIPLMITVLKQVEHDPGMLQRKLRYDGSEDLSLYQHVRPEAGLQAGSFYTIDELLFHMIAYSDNNAALLLFDELGLESLDRTLEALEVPVDSARPREFISVRHFTAFYRVLFNASYLDDHLSERALGYLARSTFDEGLRSGLPEGMLVASKFGEYSDGSDQLHEFGIVYYPDHPYLIGITTKGGSSESLPFVIREISQAVFLEIERQHERDLGAGKDRLAQ
jgi:beta-lactamase class A